MADGDRDEPHDPEILDGEVLPDPDAAVPSKTRPIVFRPDALDASAEPPQGLALDLADARAEIAALRAEIETLNGLLQQESIRDPLTGLYSRRYLDEAAAREVARAIRSRAALAVAVIDVDHLAQVSTRHGAAAGDAVMKRLADLLRAHVRMSDLLCHVGGEEFRVVLPGATLQAALGRAEQWRSGLRKSAFSTPAGAAFAVSLSVGVALHRTGETMLEPAWIRAGKALHEAKTAGGDRVRHWADRS